MNNFFDVANKVDLKSGRVITVNDDDGIVSIEILSEGKKVLTIDLDNNNKLTIDLGNHIIFKAKKEICLEADKIKLKADKEVEIKSDGDINCIATMDTKLSSRINNIESKLGNVNIKANDDVKLKGERVLLNTDG